MHILTPIGLAVGAVAAVAFAAPVSAQVAEDVIVIPIDSRLSAPPGSVTPIASVDVPDDFQGAECILDVQEQNNESVHPNNDLLLSSGSTSGVVEDFESVAFGETGALVPLTLGSTIDVSLRMGSDGRSSGGLRISVDCPVAAPPTTEPASTTTQVESQPPGQVPPPAEPPAANPPSAQQPSSTLPATGLDGATWAAVLGLMLLAGGGGLVVAARRTR